MMNPDKALQIAHQWIEAWNQRDLEAIISHYSDEIEFSSPLITKLMDNPEGKLQGKVALQAYFATGLATYPNLKLELVEILVGINSLIICFRREEQKQLAADYMEINQQGLVYKSTACKSTA